MSIEITYNVNHLQYVADNSGCFNGYNQIFGWGSHFKMNENFFLKGTGLPTTGNFSYVEDMDCVDATINDQDAAYGVSYQAI